MVKYILIMKSSALFYSISTVFFFTLFACQTERNSVDYEDCTIYRDKWGVPHIWGKKDSDVAYGLAWASCEDDFNTLQEQMLAIRGKFGEVKGKNGVVADFAIQYMGIVKNIAPHPDKHNNTCNNQPDGNGGEICFSNF